MRRVTLLVALGLLAKAQTPIITPDSTGARVFVGNSANSAVQVVCINPTSHVAESCAGGGGVGTNVTITQGGHDAIVDATGALKVLATVDTTGLATSALQTTENASLSSIDGKTPALVTGRVPVDGSGVTQPVSIAGSVAVTGTFWQATQPVSAVSLPLPSGAATAAKQPALGTAGAASTDVLTVQGIASMTALKVDGTGGTFPISGTVAVTQSTSPWVVSNGGTFAVQAAQSGNWPVRLQDGSGNALASSTTTPAGTEQALIVRNIPSGTQPVSIAAAVTVSQSTASSLNATVVGTGTFATQATLQAGSAVIGKVGIDQTTPGTTNLVSAAQNGTWNVGTLTSITNAVTVSQGTAANLNATVVGTGTFATQATLQAGSALVGKVGLDQTTPGTTNAVSLAQIGATTTATGNGVVGAGVQRVAIASDNTAFSVNATLAAETTKVIGTARIIGNAGGAFDTTNNGAAPANVIADGFEVATQGTTQPTAGTAGNIRRGVISQDGALYVRQGGPVNFTCSADAIAASLTQLTGCGGAGASLKYYITDIVAQSTTSTAGQFILRTGTGTNCGTGTASIFPSAATAVRFAAPANTSAATSINFTTPLQTAANVQICVLGVATNTVSIQVSGYAAP
jgi:hypothetical protein